MWSWGDLPGDSTTVHVLTSPDPASFSPSFHPPFRSASVHTVTRAGPPAGGEGGGRGGETQPLTSRVVSESTCTSSSHPCGRKPAGVGWGLRHWVEGSGSRHLTLGHAGFTVKTRHVWTNSLTGSSLHRALQCAPFPSWVQSIRYGGHNCALSLLTFSGLLHVG